MADLEGLKVIKIMLGLSYLPISLILSFLILSKIDASTTMWVLYWLGVPLTVIFVVVDKIIDMLRED